MLTASGILQRCLPELDDALAQHRSDSFDLDPLSALQFPRLSAVHELATDGPLAWRAVLLAALVLDACGESSSRAIVVGRRTVQRLDLGAAVEQRVAGLVGDADLLTAAARRWDALNEESVQQIAVHLESEQQARALYLLSRAEPGAASAEDAERLRALYELVADALAQPELVGREASNEIERRRAEAKRLVVRESVRERIATAPRGFVLLQQPADLARQASLCEPPPTRDEIKAVVEQGADSVVIEVVARDRVGLLAHTTAVFIHHRCSIVDAAVATWGDSVALASYHVHVERLPDERVLERALTSALQTPLEASPAPDVHLEFDNTGSPWHTRCTATARDRPGLLNALTVAFALAGANVHAARVTTDGVNATDHFDLTNGRGGKLDDRMTRHVVEALSHGVQPRQRRFGLRPRRAVRVRLQPAVDQ